MSNQNSESTDCGDQRPAWQEEGFNSHQEWQDWLNESEATDNAYDAQAEAPLPDDSEEDEGFDEEFVSEQDSENEDDNDEESESGEPGKHVEPEDDSSPDHSEAVHHSEPGVDDTSNVDETVLTSMHGFAHDKNKDYALVEQSARGALNAITIALQDIINRSQARQGDPQSLAKEIESAFATTLPTYLSVQAILQGGQQPVGRPSPLSALLPQSNQPLIGTSTAVSVPPSPPPPPPPPPPSTASGLGAFTTARDDSSASQGEGADSDDEEDVHDIITPPRRIKRSRHQ